MATNSQQAVRRVVPRWRSFRDTLRNRELDQVPVSSKGNFSGVEFLHTKEKDWQENRTLPFATDLVGTAHVFGSTPLAVEAAEYVLAKGGTSTILAKKLAASLLGSNEVTSLATPSEVNRVGLENEIRIHKKRRLAEPRNAFVWVDLARLYVLLGLVDQAEKPMNIALGLAPFDRFVIRSATRFYLHQGEPEQALRLLRRLERTKSDPWLLAAELAVSAVLSRSPKFYKQAVALLDGKNASAFHTSELAASLASDEMWSGNTRRAKKLFAMSLQDPTENALAQAVWASREIPIVTSADQLQKVSRSYEAAALALIADQKWDEGLEHSEKWTWDEPFSARPRAFASSLAVSVLNDLDRCEAIAKEGLVTNRKHPALVNNIAFSLAARNRASEAKEILNSAEVERADSATRICLLATNGLVEFRLGNYEEGRQSYEEAIAAAGREKNITLKSIAQLYLERELGMSGFATDLQRVSQALKTIEDGNSPSAKVCAKRLATEILAQ